MWGNREFSSYRENVQERTPIKTATGALLRYFDSLEIQVSPYIEDTMDLDYIRRVKIGEIEDSEQAYIQERMQNVSEDNIEQLLQYDVDSKESELEKRGTEVKTLEKKIEYILGVQDDPDHPMYEEIVSLFAERVEDSKA